MFQEKGEYKLLEFIEEMNETAKEFIEEPTSLEEQLNLELIASIKERKPQIRAHNIHYCLN